MESTDPEKSAEACDYKLRITYGRSGVAVFFSHLDCVSALMRAIRRSGLPYKVTSGCHVRPKASFGPPLPLGHSSSCELLDISLEKDIEVARAEAMLRPQFPQGFSLLEILKVPANAPTFPGECVVAYQILVEKSAELAKNRIMEFFSLKNRVIEIKRDNEVHSFSMEKSIQQLEMKDEPGAHKILVRIRQGAQGLPSASKIFAALLDFLGEHREGILDLERTSLNPVSA